MLIKSKVIFYLLCVFSLSALISFFVHWFVLVPSLDNIEKTEAGEDINRAVKVIDNAVQRLDSFCYDWSVWDDTYEFVDSQTDEYIEDNLTYTSFNNNNLNLIFIVNLQGKVIFGKIYDLVTQKRLYMQDFPADFLAQDHFLLSYDLPAKADGVANLAGIYMSDRGPMVISSRPILKSNNSGPARGTVILARFLDDYLAKQLAGQAGIDFQIISLSDIVESALSDRVKKVLLQMMPGQSYFVEEKDGSRLTGYSLLGDIRGQGALLVQLSTPKNISAKGYAALKISLILTFVSALLSLAILTWILNRNIVKPIADLTRHALSVGVTGNLSARLLPERRDEVGMLAREFDRMLKKLEVREMELASINEVLKNDIKKRQEALIALEESEERFRTLHESSCSGIGIHDDGVILDANTTLAEMTGYDIEELLGMDGMQLIAPEWRATVQAMFVSGDEDAYDVEGLRKDSSRYSLEIQGKAIPYYGQTAKITEFRDITARKMAERELERVFEELRIIFENSSMGIFLLRGGGCFVRVNRKALDLLGYETADEAVGISMRDVHVSDETFREFGEKYYNALTSGEQIQVEYKLRRRDGTEFWSTLSGKAIDSASPPDLNKGVVWIFDDITEKKQYEEKLRELAIRDSLTGIFNRRYFLECAKAEFERHRRYGSDLSLVMIDIDHFKLVNDTFGHDVGDRVLIGLTEVGARTMRETDIWGRFGGEEFVVLLPATDLVGACAIAERFRQNMAKELYATDKGDCVVTVSAGVVACSKKTRDIEALLKRADVALYTAKAKGRNLVICDTDPAELIAADG